MPASSTRRRPVPMLLGLLLLAVTLGGCDPERPTVPPAPAMPDTLAAQAASEDALPADDPVVGQTVYVPVYSHIYIQDGSREIDLTATLSIRNTDPDVPLVVTSVRYHDSGGALVRQHLTQPFRLAPLASRAFIVEERDRTGGVGANFLVSWQAAAAVSPPLVEAVMISTSNAQGISFVSRGRVVRGDDALRQPAEEVP